MFVLASVNLLIYLSVLVNAGDNGKIVDAIEPIAEAMVPFLDYAFELRSGFENVNKRTRILANVGLEVFANLTNYANSIIMLSDQYNDNDNSVDPHIHMYIRVIDGCAGVYKAVVSDDELGETSNVVKEKFLGSHRQMEQIQEIILQYAQRPMDYKNDLNETCIETNGMKDLLTDIHNDIVNKEGNNGTFNQLLDGGVSLEYYGQNIFIKYPEMCKAGVRPKPPCRRKFWKPPPVRRSQTPPLAMRSAVKIFRFFS